jgi:hypothetical protein
MTTVEVSGVWPQTVYHDAFVSWLLVSLGFPDLVECDSVFGEKSTVSNKNLFVDAVRERKELEHLTKQIIDLLVVFVLYLSFETIEFIKILGFVIASAHEEVVGIEHLPSHQSHNHLHWETTSVDEVSIEKIRILFAWDSINLENIKEIVVLSVYVSADCNNFFVSYRDVYKGRLILENLSALFNEHTHEFFMQGLLLFLVLQKLLHPFRGDLVCRLLEFWTRVARFDNDFLNIHSDSSLFILQTTLQLNKLIIFQCLLILLTCIFALWLHLAHLFEISNSQIILVKSQMSRS